jgi:hypothetical protein
MTIPFTNYADLAAALGVGYCRGVTPDGQYCGLPDARTATTRHRVGFVVDETIHMSDRKITRSAIRMFTMLAARTITGPEVDDYAPWKRTWLLSSIAEEMCRKRLHVRIPSAYWNSDRWTVRAQLIHVDTKTPQRAEAMAWTRLAT